MSHDAEDIRPIEAEYAVVPQHVLQALAIPPEDRNRKVLLAIQAYEKVWDGRMRCTIASIEE